MTGSAVIIEAVVREASGILGVVPAALHDGVKELRQLGTVRSFRCADLLCRVDEDPGGKSLAHEALVLDTLTSAHDPPIAAAVRSFGTLAVSDVPGAADASARHPFLAVSWLAGETLDAGQAAVRASDVGAAFAALHASRVMDLYGRLPRERAWTLMDSMRRTVEQMRGLLAARAHMGRNQEAFAHVLSDLVGVVRSWCIAHDHLFLVARRRVLCHGRPKPSALLAQSPTSLRPFLFAGFDSACLGDAAEDLARFAVSAGFDESSEETLLQAYCQKLEEHGRPSPIITARYQARKPLALFAYVLDSIEDLVRLERARGGGQGDGPSHIEQLTGVVRQRLVDACRHLQTLGIDEVQDMDLGALESLTL